MRWLDSVEQVLGRSPGMSEDVVRLSSVKVDGILHVHPI